jgi:curved DNA-binding protein CbpA
MRDYFALLEQPRQPWLDPEQLKQAFHRETLRAHPDAQPREAGSDFGELNEAYQVLRDAKRRLHHLLALQGEPPSAQSAAVPREKEYILPLVAPATAEADSAIAKGSSAGAARARSLAQAEAITAQQHISVVIETVLQLEGSAVARLEQASANDLAELHTLYLLFSYLSRWRTQLEERQLQLSLPVAPASG